jgi:hypothetical protein
MKKHALLNLALMLSMSTPLVLPAAAQSTLPGTQPSISRTTNSTQIKLISIYFSQPNPTQ